jgi:hypothetical protein
MNEITDEKIIEIEVAKHFTMLSAYFITAAVTSPPRAPKKIIKITKLLNP